MPDLIQYEVSNDCQRPCTRSELAAIRDVLLAQNGQKEDKRNLSSFIRRISNQHESLMH